MKKNVNNLDRVIRLILAAVLAFLYFSDMVTGIAGLVMLALAGIFVLTTFAGFCPIYAMCGWSSCPTKKHKSEVHLAKSRV